MADRYRKKPVEISAIRWIGGDTDSLDDFCGRNWGRADAIGVETQAVDDEQVVVWNTAERQWIGVPVGHWIIRGIDGELYPCAPSVFDWTYEPVEADQA